MLTFLNPVFLIGLAAAVIPLIVHLTRSRRLRKMEFSSTRFFTDQFLRSRRMNRLKEWLLLLFRMALCALFAAALAQPVFRSRNQSLHTGSRRVVLVVDNSASMGYVDGGVPLFDRAREVAGRILGTLRPGDSAALVLAARRANGVEVPFPDPTPEFEAVRRALSELAPRPLGTDLAGAVRRAEEIARGGVAVHREVYVLSDLQDTGWELQEDRLVGRTTSDVLFFFVPLRPARPENVALTGIQYAAARPVAGIPYALRPYLRRDGDPRRTCELALYVDGRKITERRIERWAGGRWAAPLFHYTFTRGGWHSGWVEITDDRLAADNRRYFAFELVEALPVLAVNGAPSDVPRLDELFFLRTALTAGMGGGQSLRLQVVAPGDLSGRDLGAFPLVILANVASLSEPEVERLERYVDGGGSLLVFLGDRVSPAFYNQNLAGETRLHGGLMPGRLEGVEGDPRGPDTHTAVAGVNFDHPALSAFQDPRFPSLPGIPLKALWRLTPGDAAILMRAGTGSVLLCEKPFGKGRVLCFTSTCDRDWTSFPVRAAYLPWAHRLVAYLAQSPMVGNSFFVTGDVVPVPVSAVAGIPRVEVTLPDGRAGYAAMDSVAGQPVFTDTTLPGVYRMAAADVTNREALFVANLESYESDLRYLDDVLAGDAAGSAAGTRASRIEAGLRDLLPGRPQVAFVPDATRVLETASTARHGLRLWDALLVVVLLIALFEPWLANRISLRHYLAGRAPSRAAEVLGRQTAAFR